MRSQRMAPDVAIMVLWAKITTTLYVAASAYRPMVTV